MHTEQVVRLSSKEHVILKLLISAGSEGLYGLQLVERSAGELARGTVYVTLDRMKDKGLVSSQPGKKDPHVGGIPRRIYRPTGYGAQVYQRWEQLQASDGDRRRPWILQPV